LFAGWGVVSNEAACSRSSLPVG